MYNFRAFYSHEKTESRIIMSFYCHETLRNKIPISSEYTKISSYFSCSVLFSFITLLKLIV